MGSLKFNDCFKVKDGDSGDLFQQFVYELLRKSDYPRIHRFQTAGRDGGIDLIEQSNKERTVVGCKYIGNEDISAAKSRWLKDKAILEDNLTGATPKQKQYSPWYRTDKPITSYIFCVSSDIRNQQGFDELEIDITAFFKSLADDHSHLKHLEKISVEIIDWNKLSGKLDNFSQLKFAWFPLPDKIGFIPIDRKSNAGSFRSFLDEEHLPFYTRSEHLKTHPNDKIADEEELLEKLGNGSTTGIIISGNGGVGKTRLTFELGRLAYKKGWVVFRCKETLKGEDINRLTEIVNYKDRVLLLFDYIETQKNFTEIIENLNIANEFDFDLKYVANCRTSYYPSVKLTPNHEQLGLTKTGTTTESELIWAEKYQESVVNYILTQGGIPITGDHLAVCKNRPILAVFILYLYQKHLSEDLNSLLQVQDFGTWILKRTRMSFGEIQSRLVDFDSEFAKLIAMLPFPKSNRSELNDIQRKLLEILANDGWIETDGQDCWRNVHDVFSDQILISYLRDNSIFADDFVRDVLSIAYSLDNLESSFIAFQRLAPYLQAIDWETLIKQETEKNPTGWKSVRLLLLETPFLDPPQKLDILRPDSPIWEKGERDVGFQEGIVKIIRWIIKEGAFNLTNSQVSNLQFWLEQIVSARSARNYILAWGLKFAPETVKDFVLERLHTKPLDRGTEFLFSAWLDTGLLKSDIKDQLSLWFGKFRTKTIASFLYKSWLDAGGDKEFVQAYIKLWLDNHQLRPEARFVYSSWLDAGGDKEFIQAYIKLWLGNHQTLLEAQFVYKSWLDAGGDKEFVKGSIKLWLDDHQLRPEARFVYPSWLGAGGDKDFVQGRIKLWLNDHQTILEAGHVYKSWLDAGGDKEFIKDSVKLWLDAHQTTLEASHVYPSWLDAGGDKDFVKGYIKLWLDNHKLHPEAQFIYKSWLDAGGDKDFVQGCIKHWLDAHPTIREASHVYKSWLNAGGDTDFVKDPVKLWLNDHQTSLEASHVYKSWLDAGGDTDFVRDYIKLWLEDHELHPEARFIYKSWLDAGGDTDFVKDSVKLWLDAHQTTEEASHIYKSWLDAGGDTDFVKDPIKLWLDDHQTTLEASHVYPSWLDAGGDADFVRDYIKLWLDDHQAILEAQFIYKSWLDAGGDKDFVQGCIELWLDGHQTTREASHVYKSWLEAGGDKDFVQDHIKLWLDDHQTILEASHIYKSWLDAGGDKDFVQVCIKLWLDDHQLHPEARFVYPSWLGAGGDWNFLREYVIRWLEIHVSDKGADFVMRVWLDAGGSFEAIKKFAIEWLAKNHHEHDAVYITKNLSKQKDLPIETIKHILYWCFAFYDDIDAIWRMTALKTFHLGPEIVQEYISAAERILPFWLTQKERLAYTIKGQLNVIFFNLFSNRGLQESCALTCVNELFLIWVRHPESFGYALRTAYFIQQEVFLRRFLYLMETKSLDVNIDRNAVKRFLQWIEIWASPNKEPLKPLIEESRKAYPSDLWDIVTFGDESLPQPAE